MKRKIFTLLAAITFSFVSVADEGMWLYSLLKQLNEKDMQAKGLELTADQLYNVNQSSVKDAILWFNGGCTGEIISAEGLVLTNHHCGYDVISSLSTSDNNILDNGFWAKSKGEELIPKGSLYVSILVRMEEVTEKVNAALEGVSATEKNTKLQEVYKTIQNEAVEGTHYEARCTEMFKGNKYFVFVYEKFTDVRLVGTPPQSIGKFGHDTDNWMWPRQTGDFSLFRIYADKDNKPATYSPDNVPYKPKHHLPVSLKGVKEGDYAMIMGFPGRTDRYAFAESIKLSLDEVNYSIVDMRDIRLKNWKNVMDVDTDLRLQLSSKYARISNYWKYFIGQSEQLKRFDVYNQKKETEREFQKWAKGKPEYEGILDKVIEMVSAYRPYAKHGTYLSEGVLANELMTITGLMSRIEKLRSEGKNDDADKLIASAEKYLNSVMWDSRYWDADKEIFAQVLHRFYNDIPKSQHNQEFASLAKKYKFDNGINSFRKLADDVYKKSMFASKDKSLSFVQKFNDKKLKKDPAYKLYSGFLDYYMSNVDAVVKKYRTEMPELGTKYVKGLMEMNPNKVFYADANSTPRLTYGSVRSYHPRDAVKYSYYSTITGAIEKYVPGDDEFDLDKKFMDLYNAKNFGRYANGKGELVANFITDNDITGGNSGSPVMNGKGHLIGLAFDGNWEAMSGDLVYDDVYKRTINVDVRYILWVIEVHGGAKHLVNEMTIVE
jgi:hypothetical protein